VAAHPGAPSDSAHAAAAVAAAVCLMEDDRADDAIPILQAALAADRAEPVDHAWLAVQLARAYVEVGRVDEAKVLAASIQGIARSHADDVTATAIAGAGIRLLFSVTAIDDGDLAATIEASDTAASWWRHEAAGWALGDVLDRTFDGWVRDGAVSYTARDEAHDELLAASLSATFLGLHDEWRAFVGLLGRDTLIRLDRHGDPATARKGLSALLRSGHKSLLARAARRLVDDGPAAAVAELAATVRLDTTTRTTAAASLAPQEARCAGPANRATSPISATKIAARTGPTPGTPWTAWKPGCPARATRSGPATARISKSIASINRHRALTRNRYAASSGAAVSSLRPPTPNRSVTPRCSPCLANTACTDAFNALRQATSFARWRTSSRSSRTGGGAIQPSGSLPMRSRSARSAASRTSFLTRR
jgi:hypothetical protein